MVCFEENRNCDSIGSDGLYFEVMEIEGEKMEDGGEMLERPSYKSLRRSFPGSNALMH
jgi:hypothetical protein